MSPISSFQTFSREKYSKPIVAMVDILRPVNKTNPKSNFKSSIKQPSKIVLPVQWSPINSKTCNYPST
jgi:hypothetical protein